MSTDREREALARLIDPRFGRIVTGVPRTFTDMGDAQALETADRILAAGWMPRPEPGSADAVLAAIRKAAETLAADEERLRRLRVFADYWPSIEAYSPPPEVADDVSEVVRAMVCLAAALGTGDTDAD